MIIDGHVHTRGHEKPDAIRRAMDAAGIDRICLISPPKLTDADAQRTSLAWISDLVAADPDRLIGFFWLSPLLPEARKIAQEAAATPGIRAFKLMSDHWYPHEPSVVAILETIAETGLPILFHAGVLWSHMDSSRFCRPAEFEIMLRFPRTRFALAHMAWPWIDECFAVAARMRDGIRQLTGGENTMFVDLSPGTPLAVREESLRRAVTLGETNRLLFGSDDSDPEKLEKAGRMLAFDRAVLAEKLGLDAIACEAIFGANLQAFLGMST